MDVIRAKGFAAVCIDRHHGRVTVETVPGDRHLEAFWTKREQAELVARSAERLTRGGFGAPEAIAQPPRGTASPFMNTRPW
jgi:hypothetical protein